MKKEERYVPRFPLLAGAITGGIEIMVTYPIEHVKVAGLNGLMKKVIKVGDGTRGAPPAGARVTLHAVGHLPVDRDGKKVDLAKAADGVKFFSTRERIVPNADAHVTVSEMNAVAAPGPQTFTLGAGTVLPAWELTAPTMLRWLLSHPR